MAEQNRSSKIRIESDGTPEGTKITNGFGQQIANVCGFTITGETRGVVNVELEMMMLPFDVEGRLTTVGLRCGICGHTNEHECTQVL